MDKETKEILERTAKTIKRRIEDYEAGIDDPINNLLVIANLCVRALTSVSKEFNVEIRVTQK